MARHSQDKKQPLPRLRSGQHTAAVLLAAALVLNALTVFVALPFFFGIRHNLTYPENEMAWSAWLAASGAPLYGDWRQWPHRFTPYGPLFYYPVGWLARLLGASDFSMLLYWLGRWQSFAYLGGIVAVGVVLARRTGAGMPSALVCVLGFLALWPKQLLHVSSFRPDAPMVFWSMLAMALATGGLGTSARRLAVVACLILSASYKYSAWAAPLAIGFLAFRTLPARTVWRWLAASLAALVLAGAIYDAFTGGLFSLNVVRGSAFGYSLRTPLTILADSNDPALLVRFVLLAAVGIWLMHAKRHDPRLQSLGLYLLLSLAISLLQMGKAGADLHYLLEPFALVGVGAAWVYWRSAAAQANASPARRRLFWAAVVVLVALPVARDLWPNVNALRRAPGMPGRVIPLEARLALPPGALLMDAAFLSASPQAHALPDPFHYALMNKRGAIPRAPLQKRLEQKQFPLIALSPVARHAFFELSKDGWMGELLQQHYRRLPGKRLPEVWVPKE